MDLNSPQPPQNNNKKIIKTKQNNACKLSLNMIIYNYPKGNKLIFKNERNGVNYDKENDKERNVC